MQLKQLLFVACLTGMVFAEGHKDKEGKHGNNGTTDATKGEHHKNGTAGADSERRQCAEISRLTELMDLVNNATRLQELETKHNLTQTQIDKLKSQAANDTTKLKTLQSNSTLMSQCAVVDADQKLKSQCHEMSALTKLSDLASNATALNDIQTKRNLTAAQIDKIKELAQNATAKLTKLKSNSTLVSACKNVKSSSGKGGSCKSLDASI